MKYRADIDEAYATTAITVIPTKGVPQSSVRSMDWWKARRVTHDE